MTTINVTAGHIADGVPDSCRLCPVALAIREAIPGSDPIAVDSAWLGVEDSTGFIAEISLPEAATRFIEAFDRGDPVQPFTFELDYPAAVAS